MSDSKIAEAIERQSEMLATALGVTSSDAVNEEGTIDRAGWGPGPWDSEPDLDEWITRAGFPARAKRSALGAWCGYVGVPPGHPMHGWEKVHLDVHGGVAFAGVFEDDRWWFGFDCMHASDLVPEFLTFGFRRSLFTYRDLAFVRDQCEHLAEQLPNLLW